MQAERTWAINKKAQLLKDTEGFGRRYLAGDPAARQQMMLLSVVLSSPVAK
jgi:hypothetical protein